MTDVNYLIRDLDILRVILQGSKDAVEADFLRIDRLQKFIREDSGESKPPAPVPVGTIAVPKEVLQGVREAASKCIDDLIGTLLCHPDNRLSHKEATAYVHRLYGKALASLDAVLAEGE